MKALQLGNFSASNQENETSECGLFIQMEMRIERVTNWYLQVICRKYTYMSKSLGCFSHLFLPAPAHTAGFSPCLVIPPAGPGLGALRGDTDVEFVNLNKELYIGITPTGSFTGKISQLEPRI